MQPGDTLFTIATRYNISVEALAAANNITNVNSLAIGDTLTIPAEGATVSSGEDSGGAESDGGQSVHVATAAGSYSAGGRESVSHWFAIWLYG